MIFALIRVSTKSSVALPPSPEWSHCQLASGFLFILCRLSGQLHVDVYLSWSFLCPFHPITIPKQRAFHYVYFCPAGGQNDNRNGRMGRGGHGLPKVSPEPAMPDPSMPCGRATHETALWPFQEWPAHRVGDLRPSSTSLDTPRCTPMITDKIATENHNFDEVALRVFVT
jgi:hypothetical protein